MKRKKLIIGFFLAIGILMAGIALAAENGDLLAPYETKSREFNRYEIGDKIVYFHQRMAGNAIVEKDFVVYQFDRDTKDLIEKKENWRTDISEYVSPAGITKEQAESMVEGDVQYSKLYIVSPESDVFPLDPTPENPCWIVTSINNGKMVITIIDSVTGKWLGYGIPPPYEGFSLGGPNWGSCDPYYTAWAENAETWFETMGYNTQMADCPSDSLVQSHVQSTTTAMFYELAHGGAYSFHNICPDSESITWGEVEDWIAGFTKMPFTFLGSCEGMCDTGDNTLSYEFRKGSFINTATVGYCHMDAAYCSTCWPYSIEWQTILFTYMNDPSYTVQQAYNQAMALYPVCAPTEGNCMRFAGDTTFKVKPVVARGIQDNPCCNVGPYGVGGCVDAAIEAAVCSVDPYCCRTMWDSFCVSEVTSEYGDTCECSESHSQSEGCYRSGEADPEHISDCVCDYDSYCCRFRWDGICVNEVESNYCGCHPSATPYNPDPASGETNVPLDTVLSWNNPAPAAPMDEGSNPNTAPYKPKDFVRPGDATLPTSYMNERKAVLEAELKRMEESGAPNPNEEPYTGIIPTPNSSASKNSTPKAFPKGSNPNKTPATSQAPTDSDSEIPPGVSVYCACGGVYETGQRVRAVVDNPAGASGIVAGSTGTVVCGSTSTGSLEILISWDNWTSGHNNTAPCECPDASLSDNSGWWVPCDTIETIDVVCACYGKYDVGTKIVALVNNPSGASGISAGATGTVFCGSTSTGSLEILISWDGWTSGHNGNGYCECPVDSLSDNSGWWVLCDEIAPAPVNCACSNIYTTNDRVRAVVDIYSLGEVKIPAGTTGTVICGQNSTYLPILISWDNWSDGHNNTGPCDCPVNGELTDNSGWWVPCEDIEKDNCPTTYDVYAGTTTNPTTVVCSDTNLKSCDPGTLAGGTTYYWKVVAKNSGGETSGTEWSFSTQVTIPCEGDFDGDGDVDGSDLAVFAADFGRTDCGTDCEGDFDGDGDVDGSDLAIFAADFGRTDCP